MSSNCQSSLPAITNSITNYPNDIPYIKLAGGVLAAICLWGAYFGPLIVRSLKNRTHRKRRGMREESIVFLVIFTLVAIIICTMEFRDELSRISVPIITVGIAAFGFYNAVKGLKTGKVDLINSGIGAAVPSNFMKFDVRRKNISALRAKTPVEYWT